MACLKNRDCLDLANNVYPQHKISINNNLDGVISKLEEVKNQFSDFDIPSDYLGSKVLEELNEISDIITGKIGEISIAKQSVDSFIDSKIYEHKMHYNDWYHKQQLQQNASGGGGNAPPSNNKNESSNNNTSNKKNNGKFPPPKVSLPKISIK
ncbi:MAG: hypothetical protein IJO57_02455 [Bacilli bacterium]|nr:hypothetical protein [Bacilli bacterium]